MNWKFWNKTKKQKTPKSFIREWRDSIVFAVIAATLIRWATVEAFVVPSGSMENTILTGDFLFVSKFHYGSRTPATPLQVPLTHQKIWGTDIPSYLPWIELPTYRIPGISKVKREDVVVFNVPPASQNKGVEYPMDLKTFYVKRCVAIGGDRFEIKNRQIFVNDQPQHNPENMKFSHLVFARDEINKRHFEKLGASKDNYFYLGRSDKNSAAYKMFLTQKQFDKMKANPFIVSIEDDFTTHDTTDPGIFPSSRYAPWNADNYGPIILPKEGMKVSINDSTLAFYGEAIKSYEHNKNVKISGGKLYFDDREITEYVFKQDYYFMVGDNRHNSEDSRYWGFVPADHIVGKPLFIWLSVDESADFFHKIRWERMFTMIE